MHKHRSTNTVLGTSLVIPRGTERSRSRSPERSLLRLACVQNFEDWSIGTLGSLLVLYIPTTVPLLLCSPQNSYFFQACSLLYHMIKGKLSFSVLPIIHLAAATRFCECRNSQSVQIFQASRSALSSFNLQLRMSG